MLKRIIQSSILILGLYLLTGLFGLHLTLASEPAQQNVQLFPYSADGKLYGYVDLSGKWAVEPQFEFAVPFSEGLAAVSLNQKYGFIDETGQIVIEPQFDYVGDFAEGLAMVNLNQKSGYIDQTGQIVVEPQYDYANDFSEGLANVVIAGKTGFIDKTGEVVIPLQFDSESRFSEGLAPVLIDGKTGFIDQTGQVVIEPQFDYTGNFSEGLASVTIEGETGFIDQTGQIVIEPQFDYANDFSEGLAAVGVDGRTGFIDQTGRMVIEPQFDYATNFSEGLAAVSLEGRTGFIDPTGRMVIEPQFVLASPFIDGLANVTFANNTWGYIDETGQPLFQLPVPAPPIVATTIMPYLPVVPTETRAGACSTNSLSVTQPFAWRCTIETTGPDEPNLFDPCLLGDDGQTLVCGADPATGQLGFGVNLTEPLPEPEVTSAATSTVTTETVTGDTTPWLIQLANGTVCNLATGATIMVEQERVTYLCSDNSAILGDLQPGLVWTAEISRSEEITSPDPEAALSPTQTAEVSLIWQPVDPAAVVEEVGLTFDDVTLNFNGVARTMQGHLRPVTPYDPNSPGLNGQPAHLQFTFDGEVASPWLDPRQQQLLIYPIEAYRAMYQDANLAEVETRLDTLQTLLEDRPQTITGTIPVLPDLWAAQVIKPQINYLDFQNGAGVRFLTHYSHAASPLTGNDLFYTFQGLTGDGQYYISFFAPVSTTLLPETLESDAGAEAFETFAEDIDAYLEEISQTLNEAESTDFTPDLAELDAMLESLQVGP